MDGNQGAEGQTALRNRHEGWSAVLVSAACGRTGKRSFGEWIRTFAVITTAANELVGQIHDRMPLILAPEEFESWLSEEPDPREFMHPFSAELMRMWPDSTRVNKPANNDADIVRPLRFEPA